jgi:hypothetical protein
VKTLSPAETIAQLAQRRSIRTAQMTRRRALAADASDAVNIRLVGKTPDAVWRHKFRVGQTVTLAPTHYGANRQGSFEVTNLLPQEHGINQYRLRSRADGHDRVANEDELN